MTSDQQRDVQQLMREEQELRKKGLNKEADEKQAERLCIINQYAYDQDGA